MRGAVFCNHMSSRAFKLRFLVGCHDYVAHIGIYHSWPLVCSCDAQYDDCHQSCPRSSRWQPSAISTQSQRNRLSRTIVSRILHSSLRVYSRFFSFLIRMASVKSQRRQLLICYLIVLVTFIPRAVFSIVNAIGNINVV
jgi:hypothetical protein